MHLLVTDIFRRAHTLPGHNLSSSRLSKMSLGSGGLRALASVAPVLSFERRLIGVSLSRTLWVGPGEVRRVVVAEVTLEPEAWKLSPKTAFRCLWVADTAARPEKPGIPPSKQALRSLHSSSTFHTLRVGVVSVPRSETLGTTSVRTETKDVERSLLHRSRWHTTFKHARCARLQRVSAAQRG